MQKIAFMFPGQGSQEVGMGKELYDVNDSVKELYQRANDLLNFDITDLMFNGPAEMLTETENTQPALLLSSVAVYEHLKANGLEPVMTVGHSLGEYSALVASGALSVEDGLKLVRTRGQLMEAAYPKGKGTMAAVLGLSEEEINKVLQEISEDEVANMANLNCPGQVVISGSKLGVEEASTLLSEAGAKRVLPLNVSGPFHSELMKEASEKFSKALNEVSFNDAKVPVYANVTAQAVTDKKEIKELLIKQLYSPVRFEESIRHMIEAGVDTFVEVGSGRVLRGLIRKIDRSVTSFTTQDLKSIDKLISSFKED